MEALITGKGNVLSFGELLLRICPDADGAWLQENTLPFYVGGAELNVATALALWNVPSKYFTALPDNSLTSQILDFLQEKNIDTSKVHYSGNRIGLYFLTQGKDLKHNALVYDRAYSSFSELKPGDINWDSVFEGVSWFHFSAICPAINQHVADVCKEALEAASKKGITISVDLNYRSKLWQYGKEPREIMPELVSFCDLIMGNIWAAEKMLGIPVTNDAHLGVKSSCNEAAIKTSEEIVHRYHKCKAVANTFRFDLADGLNYHTTLYTGKNHFVSSDYSATHIVDRVGSGDCFMAGLIYGFYNQLPVAETLEFATAAAFEKLFVKSDATNKTVDDIKKAIKHGQEANNC
ncbi:MAG: PfkB family carbohydrate kinase [Mucilaginibacter sp.]